MAQARVELSAGKSFTTKGVTFIKGKPRIVTSNDDIAYFRRCPQLKVTVIKSQAPEPAAPPAAVKKPKPAPVVEADDDSDDDGDEDDSDDEAGEAKTFLPWKPNSNLKTLRAACESRDIAYTPDDKAAVLVQMLKEHGELSG